MTSNRVVFLSHYPRVLQIVYALRGDQIPDKRIAGALQQGNQVAALKIALGSAASRHRWLAWLLFWCRHYTGWLPPLTLTLKLFALVGPSASWFTYLQLPDRSALRLVEELLPPPGRRRELILDVGCGIGQLPARFSPHPRRHWICVDKNFLSLFLAQLYFPRPDVTYVCADIELQRLFPARAFQAVVCADCFAYIYQKDVFLQQLASLLLPTGWLIIANIHQEQAGTESWGYGLAPQALQRLLATEFTDLEWHHTATPTASRRHRTSQLDLHNYSLLARRRSSTHGTT